MIAYSCGTFDILRAKDLEKLDKQIQLSKEEGAKSFGVGIYDKDLCENLGINTPLKSLEDRMKIMEQIRGVDFVFCVPTLDKKIIKKNAEEAYHIYEKLKQERSREDKEKEYEIGYVPGTYDLFHAGHLENLMIANKQCRKLIAGVKADELVKSQKNRVPVISEDERIEILRHFRCVYDVYKFYTRDFHVANEFIKSKYHAPIEAIFCGSDLENDYSHIKDFNIIYTPRDKETMKTRSTTAYRKLHLSQNKKAEKYTGNITKVEAEIAGQEITREDEER